MHVPGQNIVAGWRDFELSVALSGISPDPEQRNPLKSSRAFGPGFEKVLYVMGYCIIQ